MKTQEETAKESFGRRLARLRRVAGYTQITLAEEIGISPRMVAYYEAQTQRPPGHLLPVLADALGITTDELLGRERKVRKNSGQGHNRRLLKRLLKVEKLPKRDQRAVLNHIEALLAKTEMQGEGKS